MFKDNYLKIILLYLTTLFVVVYFIKEQIIPTTDFFQDYIGARNLYNGLFIYGEDFKVTAKQLFGTDTFCDYHPPTIILAHLPLQFFDYNVALLLYQLGGMLVLAWGSYLYLKTCKFEKHKIHLMIVTLLLCYPSLESISIANISTYNGGFIFAAISAIKRKKELLAGILIAIPAAFKLYPLLLIPALFLLNRKNIALYASISFFIINAVTITITTPYSYLYYINILLPENIKLWLDYPVNISLASLINSLFKSNQYYSAIWPIDIPSQIITLFCTLSISLISLIVIYKKQDISIEHGFAIALSGMTIASPISWAHSVLLLLPSIIWLCRDMNSAAIKSKMFLLLLLVLFFWPTTPIYRFIYRTLYLSTPLPFYLLAFLKVQFWALVILFIYLSFKESKLEEPCN